MATLNAVILPGKALKGGKHKVRISVAHNGEFRYILTDIILDSAKEFKDGRIIKRPDAAFLNTKLRGLLQKYQTAIDDMEYPEGLTCPELIHQIKNSQQQSHRTFVSVFEEYVHYAKIKQRTREVYATAMRCITACIGDKIIVDNITHATVLALDKYFASRNSPSTARNRMTIFRFVVGYAKKCGYVHFKRDPFVGYSLPPAEIRDAWLTVDQIRQIRDHEPKTAAQGFVKDLFMLSYYLGGINLADICNICFTGRRIRYERKKTETRSKSNKYVEFDMPDEAMEIVQKWTDPDGRIRITAAQRRNLGRCNSMVGYHIKKIGAELGFPNLIFYSARKSFAQHAFGLGIETSTIEYILGHKLDKGGSSLYHYVSVTPEIATKAINLVLDNLRN